MKFAQLQRIWPWKIQLPLRLRLALWSGALVLFLSFGLVLFINTIAVISVYRHRVPDLPIPTVSAADTSLRNDLIQHQNIHEGFRQLPHFPPHRIIRSDPLQRFWSTVLLELQSVSLIGLAIVTVLGGAGAYLAAGFALRPVQRVSKAAERISANTLHTRLALHGPKDEMKELADAFDTMLGRLERTFDLQGRFVADVAHELRTPLASLRTNLEIVSDDEHATIDDYRLMAATQERALVRLERLVADLLILATGEKPLSQQEVTLSTLIEEVFSDLRHAADMKGVSFYLSDESEVVVHGDGSLLARTFSNLIENAIHYNRPGGTIAVNIHRKDSWAVITVADTGVGIAQENLPHVFDRFYRVDSSRARHKGGAGLGLSIVATIVQRHGGHVQVESIPNAGSIFTVLLPV
jgi:signal transduction histidine kinase